MHSRLVKLFSFFGLAGLAIAAPPGKRHYDVGKLSSQRPSHNYGVGNWGSFNGFQLGSVNDIDILQFALMLEIEQTLFYDQAFSQFSVEEMVSVGLSVEEVIQFQNAAIIEQTHVDTLVQVIQSLGEQPLSQPQFFFQFNTPVDFVEQVAVQEQIAVSAYLGAAPLISSSEILSSAASIMCVEALQASFSNSVLGQNAFTSAFETSLSIEQVVTLVAPSISFLPSGTILDVLGFSSESFGLQETSISSFQEVSVSSNFQFMYSGNSMIFPPEGCNQLYCAFSMGGSTYYTQFDSNNGCPISNSLVTGNVVVIQITISESIDISQCLTTPQFITLTH